MAGKFAPSLSELVVKHPEQRGGVNVAKKQAKQKGEGKPQASLAPEHEPYSYYRAHPDRAREIGRRWRAKNPEKVREYGRRYRESHRTASPPPEVASQPEQTRSARDEHGRFVKKA